MQLRLNDIIRGAHQHYLLKDNQRYIIENDLINNPYQPSFHHIRLDLKSRRDSFNNDRVFNFLKKIENTVHNNLKRPKIFFFNEKEAEINTDQIFLRVSGQRWDNFTLDTGNIIGFLQCDEHHINISSRFGHQFLKYIIADADGFLELDHLGGVNKSNTYHWLLHYYWTIKLKKAYRLGLPKVYQKQTHIESKVRGQIDVVHFETNKAIGKYKSTSRNHSYLCDQNILILQAFKKIHPDFLSNDVLSIKQAFNVAGQGHKKSITELLRVAPFANPYYSDYNEVIELSKIILDKGSLDIGDNQNISGFLFDVSMLFEYFIRKLFKRNGFLIQTKNERQFHIPTGTAYKRYLYPDLIATSEGKTFLLDVKYKRFDPKYGVNREDLFQIYTYLSQLGNQQKVDYFGFIYPTNDKSLETIKKEKVNILGKEFTFLVLNLYIPEDNLDFTKEFSRSITMFINKINSLIHI